MQGAKVGVGRPPATKKCKFIFIKSSWGGGLARPQRTRPLRTKLCKFFFLRAQFKGSRGFSGGWQDLDLCFQPTQIMHLTSVKLHLDDVYYSKKSLICKLKNLFKSKCLAGDEFMMVSQYMISQYMMVSQYNS